MVMPIYMVISSCVSELYLQTLLVDKSEHRCASFGLAARTSWLSVWNTFFSFFQVTSFAVCKHVQICVYASMYLFLYMSWSSQLNIYLGEQGLFHLMQDFLGILSVHILILHIEDSFGPFTWGMDCSSQKLSKSKYLQYFKMLQNPRQEVVNLFLTLSYPGGTVARHLVARLSTAASMEHIFLVSF